MDYKEINRKLWDARTRIHVHSNFYDVQGFIKGNNPLNTIELDLLGDVRGKKILHLQCHFGLDTLALARMGAEVTGVDFSEEAISEAQNLASKTNLNAEFICCDLYDLPMFYTGKFDIIFTSYGTIGWLPDLDRWANIISRFLNKEGAFIFAEFHPLIWMFDNDFTSITYAYHQCDAIEENMEQTYTDGQKMESMPSISWNHGLSEVFSALRTSGLTIDIFKEYNYSPYDCFKGTKQLADKQYIIEKFDGKIPMVYSLKAYKNTN